MDNLAEKQHYDPVFQEYGIVTGSEETSFIVETGSGLWKTAQAASCLIRPMVGDKVLVSIDSAHGSYILAILERQGIGPYQLSFDNSVELRVSDGRFTLASQGGADIASAGDISLVSADINIHAGRGEIGIERLFVIGAFAHASLARVKLVAGVLESVAERLIQKAKRSYRVIEESEHVKAGNLDFLVRKMLSLKGKYSMITAKEDVKIDAQRIHIG